MNKKLVLTFLTLFGFSAIAMATGPTSFDVFKDLVDPNDEFQYVDNWYSSAAHYFKDINVIQGIEGNFVPEKSLSRAEMAVILKRYDDYFNNPKGLEWEVKKNNYYSVSYPMEALFTSGSITMEECDSGLMGRGDFALHIQCHNTAEKGVQDILNEFINDNNSVSYSEFVLNGHPAWKVTIIFDSHEASEWVIVEGKEKIYEIGYGTTLNDKGFETFYRSFKPLD